MLYKKIEKSLLIVVIILLVTQILNFILIILQGMAENILLQSLVFILTISFLIYHCYHMQKIAKKLFVYQIAWHQLPFAMAIINKNMQIEEVNNYYTKLCSVNINKSHYYRCFRHLITGRHHCDDCLVGQVFTFKKSIITKELIELKAGLEQIFERHLIPIISNSNVEYVVELIFDISEKNLEDQQKEEDYISMLKILVNMFEIKDPYSHGHSETVSNLARELAKALKLPRCEIDTIAKAALLHDIGKIVLPVDKAFEHDCLLNNHPEIAAAILNGIDCFTDAANIVKHHHEHYDGTGFPQGISGVNIPLGSRIIAVVNSFDCMTAGRMGQGKVKVQAALDYLVNQRGKMFDPVIVDKFLNLVQSERTKSLQQ